MIEEIQTLNSNNNTHLLLYSVVKHGEDNQMDTKSLSIVIGSCFLSETLSDGQFDNIVLMTRIPSYLLEIIMENSEKIFQVEKAIKLQNV